MSIPIGSQFTLNTILPIDDRMVKADTTARDAILAGQRFRGLIVYSIADATNYQLQAGITNSDWVALPSSGGALSLAAVGAVPNANGASATGLTLNLQPADATNPGVLTTGTQTIAGAKTLSGNLTTSGLHFASVETNAVATGAGASLTVAKRIHVITNASLTSVNNIASPIAGQLLALINSVGANVTITNDSGGTAANRIKTGTGADLVLKTGAAINLVYDSNASRWQIVGASGSSSGGGGGGGANWQPGIPGPIESYEFNEKVWLFVAAATQTLELWVKVPSSYVAGSPITLKTSFYSTSSSNKWAAGVTVYLVIKNTDAIDSVANGVFIASSDFTNTVAKQMREVSITLSAAGTINAVAVSAGDMIRLSLIRQAPASGTEDTADLRFIPSSTEILFS